MIFFSEISRKQWMSSATIRHHAKTCFFFVFFFLFFFGKCGQRRPRLDYASAHLIKAFAISYQNRWTPQDLSTESKCLWWADRRFALMINPEHAVNTDVYMQVIQTFVAVMYSSISSAETVGEGRLQFFTQKGETNGSNSSDITA